MSVLTYQRVSVLSLTRPAKVPILNEAFSFENTDSQGPALTVMKPGNATIAYHITAAHRGGCNVYLRKKGEKEWEPIGADKTCGIGKAPYNRTISILLPSGEYSGTVRWQYIADNNPGYTPEQNENFNTCADIQVASYGSNDYRINFQPKLSYEDPCPVKDAYLCVDTINVARCLGGRWYPLTCAPGKTCVPGKSSPQACLGPLPKAQNSSTSKTNSTSLASSIKSVSTPSLSLTAISESSLASDSSQTEKSTLKSGSAPNVGTLSSGSSSVSSTIDYSPQSPQQSVNNYIPPVPETVIQTSNSASKSVSKSIATTSSTSNLNTTPSYIAPKPTTPSASVSSVKSSSSSSTGASSSKSVSSSSSVKVASSSSRSTQNQPPANATPTPKASTTTTSEKIMDPICSLTAPKCGQQSVVTAYTTIPVIRTIMATANVTRFTTTIEAVYKAATVTLTTTIKKPRKCPPKSIPPAGNIVVSQVKSTATTPAYVPPTPLKYYAPTPDASTTKSVEALHQTASTSPKPYVAPYAAPYVAPKKRDEMKTIVEPLFTNIGDIETNLPNLNNEDSLESIFDAGFPALAHDDTHTFNLPKPSNPMLISTTSATMTSRLMPTGKPKK
ncbi:hypothetical protein HDU77_006320 [Chytriomyces hyalinus]|nr:hypothetical protein HDU77_006320 [Chytriomyces hyalinus]